jgi:hypothetical protein
MGGLIDSPGATTYDVDALPGKGLCGVHRVARALLRGPTSAYNARAPGVQQGLISTIK